MNDVNYGSFYITGIKPPPGTLSADVIFSIIKEQAAILTNQRPERLNSLITDTCATMRAVWNLMRKEPSLKHVFHVPCQSHSLQLLVKDILGLAWFDAMLKTATQIAKTFLKSPKWLSLLYEEMKKDGGKSYSLALAAITRWGSQLRLIRSVKRTETAIRSLARDPPSDFDDTSKEVRPVICNLANQEAFWFSIHLAERILQPIDEAITSSESDHCMVRHVIPQWIRIRKELIHFQSQYSHNSDFKHLSDVIITRFRTQMADSPAVIAGFVLDPSQRRHETAFLTSQERLDSLIEMCNHLSLDRSVVLRQFDQFTRQYGQMNLDSHVGRNYQKSAYD